MATSKQKRALAKMVENGGVASRAMIDVGYSPETAKVPSKLTSSKGFQELLKKYLPDSRLLKLHEKLLEKKEVVIVGVEKGVTEWEYTGQPHTDALKALEVAYKVKGVFNTEGQQNNQVLIINIAGESAARYAKI